MVFTFVDGTKMPVGPSTTWATDTPSYPLPLCGNFIGLNCNFHTGPGGSISSIDKIGACEIYDDAATSYTIYTKITDFTYTLFQATVTKTMESTDLGCYNEQFTATYIKDGVTISQPAFVTLTSSTKTFTVYATSASDVGVYTITIRGTL